MKMQSKLSILHRFPITYHLNIKTRTLKYLLKFHGTISSFAQNVSKQLQMFDANTLCQISRIKFLYYTSIITLLQEDRINTRRGSVYYLLKYH